MNDTIRSRSIEIAPLIIHPPDSIHSPVQLQATTALAATADVRLGSSSKHKGLGLASQDLIDDTLALGVGSRIAAGLALAVVLTLCSALEAVAIQLQAFRLLTAAPRGILILLGEGAGHTIRNAR